MRFCCAGRLARYCAGPPCGLWLAPRASPAGECRADRPRESTALASQGVQVVIDNFAYAPREITVAAGTRVHLGQPRRLPHTVTSTTKPRTLDSGAMDTDAPSPSSFDGPGTYEYFCAIHPHMTGKVIVK